MKDHNNHFVLLEMGGNKVKEIFNKLKPLQNK